jgi:hypothetical protein
LPSALLLQLRASSFSFAARLTFACHRQLQWRPLSWNRSMVTDFALNVLVNDGQLAPNVDGQPLAWIVPLVADQEPNSQFGYVVSFVRHHECGFTVLASHFMRRLCHHYGVELHNFAPNAISLAATFVGVCEGFLGIPVN